MSGNREAPAPFVAPVRLRNLVWAPLLGAAWLAGWYFGTLHLRVQYTFRGTYQRPHYTVCDYWGLASFRLRPPDGECPVFVLAGGARKAAE